MVIIIVLIIITNIIIIIIIYYYMTGIALSKPSAIRYSLIQLIPGTGHWLQQSLLSPAACVCTKQPMISGR